MHRGDTVYREVTEPINFDCAFSSISEHGFSFVDPTLEICVHSFFECVL